MKIKSFCLFLLTTAITPFSFAQYTDVINSNRPGVSRSAFSVGVNVAQIEIGPYYIQEKRIPNNQYKVDGFGGEFALRYGLIWEQLELNLEGNYQKDTKTYTYITPNTSEDRNGFRYLTAGAKYLLYDPYKDPDYDKPNLYSWKANQGFKLKWLIPAISIYAGINYDFANNPYTAEGVEGVSPRAMVATQNNFPGGWVFVTNVIKDRIGSQQADFQYIFTLTHSFNNYWVIFAELQNIESKFYADNLIRFGGAYLLSKNIQLDAAVTVSPKDTPKVMRINAGISYRIDRHRDKSDEEIDNGNGNNSKYFKPSKKKKKKNDASEEFIIGS